MPPLHRALIFCTIVGGLVLSLFVGYMFLRSLMPATDASLSRFPDIVQEAWRKRHRTAEEAQERALEASRECVANGNRYCLMEDYKSALREYTKAARLDSTNLDACLEAGRVAWLLHEPVTARAGWQKALTLAPLAATAHAGLFEMLKDGSDEDRRRAFRHAITLQVLRPYRSAPREFILLNPEIGVEIERVAGDAGSESVTETDPRQLLTKAWQALPKQDRRTADICFGRVLAQLRAAEAAQGPQ